MAEFDPESKDEHRRYVRCEAYAPVIVTLNGKAHQGAMLDMSVGGAAIELDIKVEESFSGNSAVTLSIEGLGELSAKIIRAENGKIAVEIIGDPSEKDRLAARLMGVLNDMPANENGNGNG